MRVKFIYVDTFMDHSGVPLRTTVMELRMIEVKLPPTLIPIPPTVSLELLSHPDGYGGIPLMRIRSLLMPVRRHMAMTASSHPGSSVRE